MHFSGWFAGAKGQGDDLWRLPLDSRRCAGRNGHPADRKWAAGAGDSPDFPENFLKKGIDFMEKVRYNVFLHKGLL